MTLRFSNVPLNPVFADNVFQITGSSDATKIAAFEVDGFTTGTTRTFTLPDASITVAGIDLAQTFTAAQTFGAAVTLNTSSSGLTISKTTGTTLAVASTQASTTTGSGCATFAGGVGVAGAITTGGLLTVGITGGTAGVSKWFDGVGAAFLNIGAAATPATRGWEIAGSSSSGAHTLTIKNVGTGSFNVTMPLGILSVTSGQMCIGATNTASAFRISSVSTLSSTTACGVFADFAGTATNTANVTGFQSNLSSDPSAYVLDQMTGFKVSSQTLGAGSTVTRFAGVHVRRSAIASNNAAFSYKAADNPTYTGNWFLYNDTTDASFLGGSLTINSGTLTFTDAVNVASGTTTGTKIGTATTQKIGFWNVTPVIQPAAAGQAAASAQTQQALTDSTGGSASTTLASITAGAGYLQADMTAVKNALASLAARLAEIKTDVANVKTLEDAIRTALVNTGIIKGAA